MLFTVMMNRNQDFQRLYRSGAFCSLGSAVLYAMPNGRSENRLGITAGKKVGNAVMRNRAKRIIREAYRAAEGEMPIGLDIVVVARPGLPEQNAAALTETMRKRGLRHLSGVSSGAVPCQSQPKKRGGRKAGSTQGNGQKGKA